METRDFGWALRQLHSGRRICRDGGNGKGLWLGLVKAGEWTFTNGQWDNYPCAPFIAIKSADSRIVPWLASQTDILATDWAVM